MEEAVPKEAASFFTEPRKESCLRQHAARDAGQRSAFASFYPITKPSKEIRCLRYCERLEQSNTLRRRMFFG